MDDMKEKVIEIFKDEEFTRKALQMGPEELKEALEEKGVELALEDIIEAGKVINEMLQSGDEIDEETLENVIGGVKGWQIGVAILVVGVVGGIAFCTGMAMGAAALAGTTLSW